MFPPPQRIFLFQRVLQFLIFTIFRLLYIRSSNILRLYINCDKIIFENDFFATPIIFYIYDVLLGITSIFGTKYPYFNLSPGADYVINIGVKL